MADENKTPISCTGDAAGAFSNEFDINGAADELAGISPTHLLSADGNIHLGGPDGATADQDVKSRRPEGPLNLRADGIPPDQDVKSIIPEGRLHLGVDGISPKL